MNLRTFEEMEAGFYPVRVGEPDCAYFLRTGLCRYGATCRFNHPPNRPLAIATATLRGEYPERPGQPECEYYLKTGTCKFGATCKFDHPRDKAGFTGRVPLNILGYPLRPYYLKTGTCKFGATCKFDHPRDKAGFTGRVPLNILGYPLRPAEVECSYYLKTGECKFGSTCKFHHPEPSSNPTASLRGSSACPPIGSPSTPVQQSHLGSLTSLPSSRSSILPSPRWQGPSSYPHLVLPKGVMPIQGLSAYIDQQQTPNSGKSNGTSRQSELASAVSQRMSSPFHSGPLGFALRTKNPFPQRPGEPECQFYMKNGDCKFGAACKFHHPTDKLASVPDGVLSPIGLPLRPGAPLCIFYSRYGICKFGPCCKFDHPIGVFTSNIALSSADTPLVRRLLASSSSSGVRITDPRCVSRPESRRQLSSGEAKE